MKVLKCDACGALVPMAPEDKACPCGACHGRYVNLRKVEYAGPGRMLGVKSLIYFSGKDWTKDLFEIPDSSPSVVKLDD